MSSGLVSFARETGSVLVLPVGHETGRLISVFQTIEVRFRTLFSSYKTTKPVCDLSFVENLEAQNTSGRQNILSTTKSVILRGSKLFFSRSLKNEHKAVSTCKAKDQTVSNHTHNQRQNTNSVHKCNLQMNNCT